MKALKPIKVLPTVFKDEGERRRMEKDFCRFCDRKEVGREFVKKMFGVGGGEKGGEEEVIELNDDDDDDNNNNNNKDDENLTAMMEMGFERNASIAALRKRKNVGDAVHELLSGKEEGVKESSKPEKKKLSPGKMINDFFKPKIKKTKKT